MPIEKHGMVRVIRDPTFLQLNELYNKCKNVRGLISADALYIWDAFYATHYDLAVMLGMPVSRFASCGEDNRQKVAEFQLYQSDGKHSDFKVNKDYQIYQIMYSNHIQRH